MNVKLEDLQVAFRLIDKVPQDESRTSQFVKMVFGERLTVSLAGLMTGTATAPLGEKSEKVVRVNVERRYLRGFLATARDQDVELKVGKDSLHLKCGFQKSQLGTRSIEGEYPKWAGTGQKMDLPDWLKVDLNRFTGFCNPLPGAEHFGLVQVLGKYGVLATDTLALIGCLDKTIGLTIGLPQTLAQIAADLPEAVFYLDKQAMVLKLPYGYITHPLCESADKYPTKRMREFLDQAAKAPTKMVFTAAALHDEIGQVGTLSTAALGATLKAVAKPGQRVLFTVQDGVAKVERSVEAEVKGSYDATWQAKPVSTFTSHMTNLKSDIDLDCGRLDGASFFRAKVEDRVYLLVMADLSSDVSSEEK